MIDLNNKRVLVTGAAGGLGVSISLAFARAGAMVLALDLDSERAQALSDAARNEPQLERRLQFVAADLADLPGLRSQLDALLEREGGVDILINNAAIYPSKPLDDYSLAEYRHVQCVNADSALVCSLAALPHMKRQQFGRIVNVTSITVYGGWSLLLPYVTSKGALLGMTRALARELGPHGITVNAVCPGAFPTNAEKIHPDPEGYEHFVLEHQSLKRRGSPQDVANAMLFFASDLGAFVTGQSLNVDGGWVMQ